MRPDAPHSSLVTTTSPLPTAPHQDDDAALDARAGTRGRVAEVAVLFLRLGLTAFGGPLAHIALMREEVVRRRRWVAEGEFLDLVAATNLLPGPNSTELAIHLGHRRAGKAGLVAAGLSFIVPAALVVLALAWLYVSYQSTPDLQAALRGLRPVVVGIVVVALAAFVRDLGRRPVLLAISVAAGIAYLLPVHELLILVGGAVAALGARAFGAARGLLAGAATLSVGAGAATAGVTLTGIFLTFLKVGALLYGSGYVLVAYIRADLVERLGWLTDRQLLDAISVGQATPGPVFTTATFVGYLLAGVPGAVVATVAIFLPGFAFAALLSPLVRALRSRVWASAALDGVVAASLGLMGGVTLLLARAAFAPDGAVDYGAVVLGVIATALVASGRVGATPVLVGGLVVGLSGVLGGR